MPAVASVTGFIDNLDLNLVYMGCIFIGVVFSAGFMVMGHMSDLGHGILGDLLGGHHGADGQGSVHILMISPLGLAALITSFGACGLITRSAMGLAPLKSVLVSAAVGLVLDGVTVKALFTFFSTAQSSTVVQDSDLVGLQGEVIAPITAGGVGQIAFTTAAGRQTAVARTDDGSALETGQFVQVERMIGNTALVRPVRPDLASREGE